MLQVNNLTTIFPTRRGTVNAVSGVSLDLQAGEILGVVGESGCGKSVTMLSILRLVSSPGRITAGEINFQGRDLLKLSSDQIRKIRGKEIAMVFQDPLTTLNPVFSVGEQIQESLRIHGFVSSGFTTRSAERKRVLKLMDEVGISAPMDRYHEYPHQFSGGMQQRALIAMALACEPKILLADEPTTALDVTIQAQIIELLRRINRTHQTAIVLVTHNLGLAAEFCQRLMVMYAGRVVELGTTEQVTEQPAHPYTHGLLSCIPRLTSKTRIEPIPGEVPDLVGLPDGCAFHPRCQFAQVACLGGPIPWVQIAPGQRARCLRYVNYRREPTWTWNDTVNRND
ncbi:MAG: ABC transporter ATP-binding protein [Chloroflexi bacterium]|nr:ABC transporter ATP-binding protein [Chloroflexota bacterium]